MKISQTSTPLLTRPYCVAPTSIRVLPSPRVYARVVGKTLSAPRCAAGARAHRQSALSNAIEMVHVSEANG